MLTTRIGIAVAACRVRVSYSPTLFLTRRLETLGQLMNPGVRLVQFRDVRFQYKEVTDIPFLVQVWKGAQITSN